MLPLFDAPPETADVRLASLLPEKLCHDHTLVPVGMSEDTLDVAFVTFEDMLMVDELQLLTGMTIRPLMAPLSVVEKTIDTLFRTTRTKFLGKIESFAEEEEEGEERPADEQCEEILDIESPPPPGPDGRIIRMVNQILEQALRTGASDIHLEPFEDSCAIRLRVDGVLRELSPPPMSLFVPIVSRFKILAKMDIAEKRVPQDGAIAPEKRRQARRPPRQHRAHRLRREDGDANPRQGRDPHPTDRPGIRRAAVEGPDRVDPNAARADARHRSDRQRQEHDALRLPQPAERAGHEHLHRGRPGGVQVQGDEPGPGEGPGGPDVRQRPAGLSRGKTRT